MTSQVATQCAALGLRVGDTIIGREQSGNYWHEARLTLLWIGNSVAVWNEQWRSSESPEWSSPEESSDWTLEFRKWKKVQTYTAKLKTRRQLEAIRDREGYVDAWGWWADVCPGKTLQLRDATADDLARCCLRENASRDQKDWLCELFEGGSLVARSAVKTMTPNA